MTVDLTVSRLLTSELMITLKAETRASPPSLEMLTVAGRGKGILVV